MDVDAAAVADAAEVDAVASKPSPRPSRRPPQRAQSPTCLGPKLVRKKLYPRKERKQQR